MNSEYYQIIPDRQDRFGIRYFQYVEGRAFVLQIVLKPGLDQKGRSHAVGIYQISRTTFLLNYLSMAHVQKSTQDVFDISFKEIFNQLSTK